MGVITWFARALLVGELLLLVVVHATWLAVYERLGRAPRYGSPESWSYPPLSDYPNLLHGPCLTFFVFCCVFPLAPTASLFTIWQAARRPRDRRLLAWAAAGALVTLAVYLDPLGALNWFMD